MAVELVHYAAAPRPCRLGCGPRRHPGAVARHEYSTTAEVLAEGAKVARALLADPDARRRAAAHDVRVL